MKLRVTEIVVVMGTTRLGHFARGVLDAKGHFEFYAGKTGVLFSDFARDHRLPKVGETVDVELRYDRRPYIVSRPLGWEAEEYSVYQV